MTTEANARSIAASVFGEQARFCERFTTGLTHWVYDVVLESGTNVVVRLSDPDSRAALAGGVFWHEQLTSVGVPVARVLASDVDVAQPYMVLERLPGTDLGNVFDDLTNAQLRSIARDVLDMQQRTHELPQASGYGYAHSYQSDLLPTWRNVMEASIARSTQRIRDASMVDERWADMVAQHVAQSAPLLDAVEPVAFLHDATTKNVIVFDGVVSGLVDVDQMAFGDPLWTTALTRMSLLSARRSIEYIDFLVPEDVDRRRLDLYTAVFCVGFLAELGQQFNQTTAASVDLAHQDHLQTTLLTLLAVDY